MMYQTLFKRVLDIIVALLLLPFTIIILLPVAIAIKIEDKGKVFYSSTRLGKDIKPFMMFKVRSMIENAPDIRNEDGTTFNSANDNRVTKVGRFIRKTSIDELPQLLNVLIGDMSLVGPRPSPLGDKTIYPDEFFLKFRVKPGITGYSQAKVRNNASMSERIELDSYYVRNLSFRLDIKVILLTIISVLLSKNLNRN